MTSTRHFATLYQRPILNKYFATLYGKPTLKYFATMYQWLALNICNTVSMINTKYFGALYDNDLYRGA